MPSPPAKPRFIGEPRPLTREDMATIFDGAFRVQVPASAIRTAHHRVARMAAAGLRNFEIAERTGRSQNNIAILLRSPAMKELIAHYVTQVNEKFIESTDEYHSALRSNMARAEDMIADRLDEAEEGGTPLPLKDLLAITRDAADRLGYGKHSTKTIEKGDFAAQLERAVQRSNRVIDVTPEPTPDETP